MPDPCVESVGWPWAILSIQLAAARYESQTPAEAVSSESLQCACMSYGLLHCRMAEIIGAGRGKVNRQDIGSCCIACRIADKFNTSHSVMQVHSHALSVS